MAKSWTARLDKPSGWRTISSISSLVLCTVRAGQEPQDIDPSRLVVVTQIYVSPPERDEVSLPGSQASPENLFGADSSKPVKDSTASSTCLRL